MFIRINTLRINCDAIASYKPTSGAVVIINLSSGLSEGVNCKTDEGKVNLLLQLDNMFEIKDNLL